jgi:MYXO-CTERM domain-containing protein
MLRALDGSWRTIGIASTLSGPCGGSGSSNAYAYVPDAIPWVESESGIDITPCHDVDGTWNPTPACDAVFAGDHTSTGSNWSDWCAPVPTSGPLNSCGDAWNANPESDPPTVAITAPTNGATFMTGGALADVFITADADDGAGVGLKEVRLLVNGADVGADNMAPYEWSADFPAGGYILEAVAVDYFDNEATSEPVAIGVDQDPPELPGEEETDDGGATDGGATDGGDDGEVGTGTEGDGGTATPDEKGCGCHADTGNTPVGLAWFGLLGLVAARRRR